MELLGHSMTEMLRHLALQIELVWHGTYSLGKHSKSSRVRSSSKLIIPNLYSFEEI
jgi:hypothetical protein